jgi:hypothetical protein
MDLFCYCLFTGNYQLFDAVADKITDMGRYLFGLTSATLLDTNVELITDDTTPLGDNTLVGPDGSWVRMFREIHTTARPDGTRKVFLNDAAVNNHQHTFQLHRFTHILANALGITVFEEDNLEDLLSLENITLPEGRTYDDVMSYDPPTTMDRRSIVKALRLDGRVSNHCDVDHKDGYGKQRCHGLGHSQPTSHRLNTCWVYTRSDAGHWCWGLLLCRYDGGQRTTTTDYSFVNRITWNEEGVPHFDLQQEQGGGPVIPVPDLDPFSVIAPAQVPGDWLNRVDCYCAEIRGDCLVCLCTCREMEGDSICPRCRQEEENDDDNME